MQSKDKHPTEIIQELDKHIFVLENLIPQLIKILDLKKSKLEDLKHQKQSLLNYLND